MPENFSRNRASGCGIDPLPVTIAEIPEKLG
jgi:hypothetical protein